MEQITRENYYDYGDDQNIIVSNSMISVANPWEGGSVEKLRAWLLEKEEKADRLHLEKGKLLHLYLENPEAFLVDEGVKPSNAVSGIIESLMYRASAASHGVPGSLSDWSQELVAIANEVGWNPKWGDKAKCDNLLKEGNDYWEFLKEAEGKHILKESVRDSLEGMINSIGESKYYDELTSREISKEVPIIGRWTHPLIPTLNFTTKSMVDRMHLSRENGTNLLRFSEIKTTGMKVDAFFRTKRVGFADDSSLKIISLPGSYYKFRYYRQLKFYKDNLLTVFPDHVVSVTMFVVESTPPYELRKFTIDLSQVEEYAAQEIAVSMQTIAKYVETYCTNDF